VGRAATTGAIAHQKALEAAGTAIKLAMRVPTLLRPSRIR
jgi:hypothetical protein